MIQRDILASITDDDLFVTVQRLTARTNVALADLLAHLGEVERRGIHRLRACASLYTYCIYELRMSEDAAYRRSKAARLVREFPELHDAIAKGEIHLTGVLMIGPYLGGEHHAEVLRRARFRSKRELLRLIAQIDPKPEVPALVEPIGPAPAGPATHRALVEALSGPVRDLPAGSRPEDWIADPTDGAAPCDDGVAASESSDVGSESSDVASESSDVGQPPESAELPDPIDANGHERALRYRVQFTASQEFVDLLQEASDLIGHETPLPTLPEIQLRALRALVQQLRTRKRGATRVLPAPAPDASRTPEALARIRAEGDAAPPRVGGVEGGTPQAAVASVIPDTAPARVASVAPDAAPARVPSATVAGPPRVASVVQARILDLETIAAPARVASVVLDATAPPRVSAAATGTAPARIPGVETIAASAQVPTATVTGAPHRRGRHIPAAVRRGVSDRDAGRCAYRDERGERCRETRGLEFHHRRAFALGGGETVDNLELRCRAHNTLAAEEDFGRQHMDLARGVADRTASETDSRT